MCQYFVIDSVDEIEAQRMKSFENSITTSLLTRMFSVNNALKFSMLKFLKTTFFSVEFSIVNKYF